MARREKVYVVHDCRNCKDGTCDNRFLFEDKTRVKDRPPTWAYCPECCKKLGINFEKQKPSDYRSEAQAESLKNLKSYRDKDEIGE